jgi:hypothetical protein
MKSIFRSPIAALIVMALIGTGLRCAYASHQRRLSSPAEYVAGLCWGVPVAIWMNHDALRRRRRPCFDFGLFLLYAFPLSMLWYCFWSRGWRGLLLLIGLGSLLFVPLLIEDIVFHAGG